MKNFDIVKWAKEEQLALSKMDDNSKYVARYLECTLLPKLEEALHFQCDECTAESSGTQPTDVQHTQPAICAHLKVNHLCYVWGYRGKKVCACCEKARKQQAGA